MGHTDAAQELFGEIEALRARVAEQGIDKCALWRSRISRREFLASAQNFANYLCLRSDDLRPLQRRLMVFGLSSLGRAEGRVAATLDAVSNALGAVAGLSESNANHFLSNEQFFEGERTLERNTEALFGVQGVRRCRILATLDTGAADDRGFVLQLAEHGVDAVRINCAHDEQNVWGRMVDNIRHAESVLGRKLPILMDIAGPKVRTVGVATPAHRRRLRIGDEILLCRDLGSQEENVLFKATCAPEEIFDGVTVGDTISIDDGKLRGRIVRQSRAGLVARMESGRLKGIKLKAEKGLNFPGVELKLDSLTEQDLVDLDFIVGHADMVGYSFVESADQIARLQQELAARRSDWRKLALVAKIETPRAVHNLPEIIVQAAGQQPLAIMIARGDLAVELGFTRLAEMQEEILWLCEAAHIPAIWATQVLEGLVTKGLASRGEMTDAAMAGRAECTMLNKGPNLLIAIETLDRLLRRMAEHQLKKTPTLRALHSWAADAAQRT
jgi:pyruvate kinase